MHSHYQKSCLLIIRITNQPLGNPLMSYNNELQLTHTSIIYNLKRNVQASEPITSRASGGPKHKLLTRMKTKLNLYKGMRSPSTQNCKTLGLWVFFLICYSTFSILLNVGLRLTLGYPTS